METFDPRDLKKLFRPKEKSGGEDNGQVTIIGGSKLFHGAPIFALKTASRIVDMVFFASPEPSIGEVAAHIKSALMSFIWVPWEEVDAYIAKSDAILIGPGFMRFRSEKVPQKQRFDGYDASAKQSREVTGRLLKKFPGKKWVIDAGSLQVMDPSWIPPNSIITPNKKEYEILFDSLPINQASKKFNCTIVLKGPETLVCSPEKCVKVVNGNPGMTKGGTGDVLSGLTVALYAKNETFVAATAASYIEKFTADELFKEKGTFFNADDLADKVPQVLSKS